MPEVPGKASRRTESSNKGTEGPEVKSCVLCGLRVRHTETFRNADGETLHFCCPGCLGVFQILFNRPEGPPSDYKDSDLYRACVEAGLIRTRSEAGEGFDPPAPDGLKARPPVAEHTEAGCLTQELTLRVEGMWCASCAWLIEEILQKTDGIQEARVLFLSDIARIRYFPHRISPAGIESRIARLGYKGSLLQDAKDETGDGHFLYRLGVSAILSMNIMMISFALYWGFFEDLGKEGIAFLSYPIWVLATPVVFYGGFPILKRAFFGLRHRNFSMDTLIAAGSLSAYFYSLVRMAQGSLHLYFDVASMLVTMVLLGKFIELRACERLSKGLQEFYSLAHGKVRLLRDGMERWVQTASVVQGEEFLVTEGERVPLDGEIISGRVLLDESILTGESRPVERGPGDEVAGGTSLLEGELRLRAVRAGTDSSLNRMFCLVQDALARKNPVEVLADRITRRLVPAVLVLAAATGIFLIVRGTSMDEALMRALTVLVITCPCALGIAIPLAKVASIDVGRAGGMLVSDPGAIERAKETHTFVFDKTGTLTEGSLSLQEVFCPGLDQREVLFLVASVESKAKHFLAGEIVRAAGDRGIGPGEVDGPEVHEGLGVEGIVRGLKVAVGNRRFMACCNLRMTAGADLRAKAMEDEGSTVVFFGWESLVRGCLIFGDRLKEGALEAVSKLRDRGISLWMISGDSRKTTGAISRQLGISQHRGEVLPADKARFIRDLQRKGQRVGMVGDGINDAAALAQADIGIALGAAANAILHEASDVTILSRDPGKVLDFLDLSNLTVKVIGQNLFFAFFYNAAGIPLAMSGAMNPLVAVLAMFVSSLTVIGNTLRISRRGRVSRVRRASNHR